MKTSVLTALLVFTIQVMVKGQTLASQVEHHNENFLRPTVKHVESKKTSAKTKSEAQQTNNQQAQETQAAIFSINQRIEEYNKQAEALKAAKAKLDEDINAFFLQQSIEIPSGTVTYQTALASNPQIKITLTDDEQLIMLLNEAEQLSIRAQAARHNYKSATGSSQQAFLSQVRDLEQQFLLKQIEALELSGKVALIKYGKNQTLIETLVSAFKGSDLTRKEINQLMRNAEHCMMLSKQIREEAQSQPTLGAKYGSMSNAEEKEWLALNDQQKAISILETAEKTAALHTEMNLVCLAE